MSHVPTIGGQEFQREVLQSELPVLVDFYADRYGPCRAMSSAVDELAVDVAGKAKVVRVDTDAEPELASAFHISTIPAFYVIHHGQVVDGTVGVTTPTQLREMIDRAVEDNVEANE